MVFVACGLNHKTAPLDVREKIAFPPAIHNQILKDLMNLPSVNEAAILSTCNRTELYCHTNEPNKLASWLANQHQLAPELLSPHLYVHPGHQGIRHTLRVASGLDSMMLGEPQILGQMKQAYQQACQLGTAKTHLRHAFQYIFGASKRIRNHSGIGNNPVSVAYAAVQLIGTLFSDYKPLQVFIIGSGETASLVAKYLHKQGVKRFLIASRSSEHAEPLAAAFQGQALSIGDIPNYLSQADVIISATACPLPFINKSLVEYALNQRHQAPMFFLDLAVPRDIEADVGELESVHLYNIDDLQRIAEQGMTERRYAAVEAEHLVDVELDQYIRWQQSLQAKDLICNYRSHMQTLAQQELQRAQEKLLAGTGQERVLSEFCERLVNKLTHHSTVGLRHLAQDGRFELLDLANYLFNLSPSESS